MSSQQYISYSARQRHQVIRYTRRIHVNNCLVCARRKAARGSKAPLQPIPIAEYIWQRVAMDIMGPVPQSYKGNEYILVIMEYTTRYVIALPLKETSSNTVMRKFIKHIVNREGIPSEILTDRGSNFLSHSMDELCQQLGIKQLRTIAYHPQTDGAVERFNRTLGDMLTAHVANEPDTPAQDKRILLLKRFRRSRTNNTADNLHLSSPLPRTW